MKRLILCLAFLLIATPVFASGHGAHWGYSGHGGPEHWGDLDEAYIMCKLGNNQSPIDLTGFIEADLAPLKLNYKSNSTEILNNGHAIQINYEPGSTLTIDGMEFELKQYHFHAPSENTINGKSFAMEAHLVHADKDGNLAVIAVMYEAGKSNKLMKTLWKKMPSKVGDKKSVKKGLNVNGVLPEDKTYYRFNGSLTTPPCSEGVRWFVLSTSVTVSEKEIKKFEHTMHGPTNRPVQPKNARPILK